MNFNWIFFLLYLLLLLLLLLYLYRFFWRCFWCIRLDWPTRSWIHDWVNLNININQLTEASFSSWVLFMINKNINIVSKRGPNRVRTSDLLICSQMLYHWAMDPIVLFLFSFYYYVFWIEIANVNYYVFPFELRLRVQFTFMKEEFDGL